jgi:hypothetical protein
MQNMNDASADAGAEKAPAQEQNKANGFGLEFINSLKEKSFNGTTYKGKRNG